MPSVRPKIVLLMSILVITLTGCAAKVPTVAHSAADTIEYKTFSAPSHSSRIYFLNGITTGPGPDIPLRHGFSSELLIDGVMVGHVNKSDVLVFDVQPSEYTFSWRPTVDHDAESDALQITTMPGQIIVLRSVFNSGGSGFGLVGSLISPPSTELQHSTDTAGIKGLEFVTALDCPVNICTSE